MSANYLALSPPTSPIRSPIRELIKLLVVGLRRELDLSPKPGLVDRWDNGSHDDLDYPLMARSIRLLKPYFSKCVTALETQRPIEQLRELGIDAERIMFEQLGANTHRGAIFLGGLLLAGVHTARSWDRVTVKTAIADVAHRLFATGLPTQTKGSRTRDRYRAGGIIQEALNGLPSVFEVGVPALREARQRGLAQDAALFLAMARLMQKVEDTTALRRCGPGGLTRLKRDGTTLEALLLHGYDPISFLTETNHQYCCQRLTMGGVADLLAISIAWGLFESQGHSPEPVHRHRDLRFRALDI